MLIRQDRASAGLAANADKATFMQCVIGQFQHANIVPNLFATHLCQWIKLIQWLFCCRESRIKLDGGGCLLLHAGELRQQRAAPAEVVDTTGAGDAFTAAFAVALLEGESAPDAASLAIAASELAVMVYGSQPAYPSRDRLLQQLRATRREWSRWQNGR